MLPTRDPPQNKRPIQTKSERLGKNIPSKWTGKKSWCSNTHIRQNKFQNKGHKKRQRRPFIILRGRIHQETMNIVNICAPNIGTPKYIKKILKNIKKDMDSNTYIRGF